MSLAAHTSEDAVAGIAPFPGSCPTPSATRYWLVNARLGVQSSDDSWELAVYAKNLFNQGYSTFGNSAEAYGNILLWGDPRIIGVEATFKF